MPLKAELDAIDWKILRELQNEGRITNVELSSRVGISAPPCLRRVRRLEDLGIIRGYRALLNAPALGMDVVAFCLVGLHHQSDAELKAFADRTRNWPIVREAWMVSGESDFLLHCVAGDLATFQSFVIEELTSAPNVDTVRTALTIRQVKDEGAVFIPYPRRGGQLLHRRTRFAGTPCLCRKYPQRAGFAERYRCSPI